MNKFTRFLYLHKLVVFNVLLFVVVLAIDPNLYGLKFPPNLNVKFILGVLLLVGLFLEYSSLISKSKFIYSHKNYEGKKVALPIRLLFFPRLLISGSLLALSFRGVGILEQADWILLFIVLYATVKELWARKIFFSPDFDKDFKISGGKVLLGESLFFLFKLIAYLAFWWLFFLETPHLLKRAIQPPNYAIFGPLFLLATTAVMMPYLVEENLRDKKKGQKVIAYLSLLLPTIAFLLQLAKLKYLG